MLNAVVDRRVEAHLVDQLVELVDQPVVQVDLEVVTLVIAGAQLILAVATSLARADQQLVTVGARLHQQVILQQADQALPAAAAKAGRA